ncbi:DUF3850 domain-containing protein [Clostridium sp. D33t1_170424_F3]|uniref:DUF3850 domain-containing protein n=1 Tax=Clostridium sp. D33t1_170424_F3 TaxID=2787099 RepID=UPI0018A97193
MLHDCKILPEHFNNVLEGLKSFEIRNDDRNPPYRPGDELMLREWSDGAYTGRWLRADVPLVLRGEYCRPGYCTMSIHLKSAGGLRLTRFQALKMAATPEDIAIILNANERRFCPHAYDRKQDDCDKACGACIVGWLDELV